MALPEDDTQGLFQRYATWKSDEKELPHDVSTQFPLEVSMEKAQESTIQYCGPLELHKQSAIACDQWVLFSDRLLATTGAHAVRRPGPAAVRG